MILVSVKEYCNKNKLTDGAVRKAMKSGKLPSIIIDNITHVAVASDEVAKLKTKVKLLNSKIRELKNKVLLYTNQEQELQKRADLITKLEAKLDTQIEKKEELYEKVIAQFNIMLIENKKV